MPEAWHLRLRMDADTGGLRVVVTQIGSDGTIKRRMVGTAGRSDAFQWDELVAYSWLTSVRSKPSGTSFGLCCRSRAHVATPGPDLGGRPLLACRR